MKKDFYEEFASEWASRLRSGKNVTHEYLVKPALFETLGDVKGKDILCVGCGSGEECKMLFDLGAKRVVGIDLSSSLIKIAKKSYPEIEFHVMDMEEMTVEDESFDIIVSNLVMHYVPAWTPTLIRMKKILKPQGEVVVMTNHPVRFGAEIKRMEDREIFLLGYIRYLEAGVMGDVIGDYLHERKVKDSWFRGRMDVEYYHRPLSSIINEIHKNGFKIKELIEPAPPAWVQEKEKSFYNIHTKIPLFMIFRLGL